MADLVLDVTDRATRAWLVREITREQERADHWKRATTEYKSYLAESYLAESRAAIVKYTDLLADGDDPCPT